MISAEEEEESAQKQEQELREKRGQEGPGSRGEYFSREKSGVALKKRRREDSRGFARENKDEEKVLEEMTEEVLAGGEEKIRAELSVLCGAQQQESLEKPRFEEPLNNKTWLCSLPLKHVLCS